MKRFLILTMPLLFFAGSAKAVCPVCTVAVSTGVGLCRWLGVDDLISGAWIGGLTVSMIIWSVDWLKRKNIVFKLRGLAVSITMYFLIVYPLYIIGVIGHPANTFLGIDKLLFGITAGSLAFLLSTMLHNFLKSKNNGKSYFPYQKIAVPVLVLIIISVIFYFIPC